MYTFYVRVFATGAAPTSAAPLPITFEAAYERLAQLPSMFIELDGSFVWRSPLSESPAWQVDGNLFDRGESLFYVELKGCCPPEKFQQILNCVRDDVTELAYEWVERGLLMNEANFRRSAENHDFLSLPRGD